MEAIAALIFIGIGAFIYFLPTAVGWKKRNASAIFVLNLLLGWTLIGWVVALVWATTNEAPVQKKAPTPTPPLQGSTLCAACGKFSHAGSKFCPHCGAAMA